MMSCLVASPYSPLLMIEVEKTLHKNTDNQHLDGVFIVFILWNSKKYTVTCLGENKNFFSFCNLVTIIANQFIYFATLVVTHCFKYAFLCSLSSYELKTFPIYIRVETFVRGQFHKFAKVFSSQKFILNFQMDLLKR